MFFNPTLAANPTDLLFASLAHVSPEVSTWDRIIDSRAQSTLIISSSSLTQKTLLSLPVELLLQIRELLQSLVLNQLVADASEAQRNFENALVDSRCADCAEYNVVLYGESVWDWIAAGQGRSSGCASCEPSLASELKLYNLEAMRTKRDWLEAYVTRTYLSAGDRSVRAVGRRPVWDDLVPSVLGAFSCEIADYTLSPPASPMNASFEIPSLPPPSTTTSSISDEKRDEERYGEFNLSISTASPSTSSVDATANSVIVPLSPSPSTSTSLLAPSSTFTPTRFSELSQFLHDDHHHSRQPQVCFSKPVIIRPSLPSSEDDARILLSRVERDLGLAYVPEFGAMCAHSKKQNDDEEVSVPSLVLTHHRRSHSLGVYLKQRSDDAFLLESKKRATVGQNDNNDVYLLRYFTISCFVVSLGFAVSCFVL